jgi:exopolysaccharide biosynthesis polyprenyl glycosylphosphotransferase
VRVTSIDHAALAPVLGEAGAASIDDRTLEILRRRNATSALRRRGWLIRRGLVVADLASLTAAFAVVELAFGPTRPLADGAASALMEVLIFLLTLPFWVLAAKVYGLYDRDEERTDHSTVDEFAGVFNVVTFGSWVVFAGSWLTSNVRPEPLKLMVFWALAVVLVTVGRGAARSVCRRNLAYLQNTVIVGAGDVGQLIARKVRQHPEYGINLVGFVDADPKQPREDLGYLALLGPLERLPEIVSVLDVERVIISFSREANERVLDVIRLLKDEEVQVDIVPRLFEVFGARVGIHSVEGLPLVGLPPVRIPRSSRALKRAVDVIGALLGLLLVSPVFAYAAIRIKLDSPGPVFFRQTRLGMNRRPFTALKFRTMRVDVDDSSHREYIRQTMTSKAAVGSNGLYKLDRSDAITRFGAWLRRTSLDELPQLLNVLRGDMSLVGPRPCLAYETEHFAPHHFERFLVPAGMTGLWQVTARAHSTFGEALDMDVAYARGWSLGLDLRLLFRTPFEILRAGETA